MSFLQTMKYISFFLSIVLECGEGFKIFQFTDRRGPETGAFIQNNILSKALTDLTICIAFNIKLVKNSRILVTLGTNDLAIQIPGTLDRFYTKFKGIWYLTPPRENIEPYHFGTFCMSYEDAENKIMFAFNGYIMLEKKDPLLKNENISRNFLNNIALGHKGPLLTFSGDITRLNIWSKTLPKHILERMTSCDGMPSDGGDPDLLNWQTTKWNISDAILVKENSSYPCSFHQRDSIDVLMPYAAQDLYDAIDTCTVLGGKMKAPKFVRRHEKND